MSITVARAEGIKCPRCYKYSVSSIGMFMDLCQGCREALRAMYEDGSLGAALGHNEACALIAGIAKHEQDEVGRWRS